MNQVEKWVPITGNPGYEISTIGNVRSFWRRVGKPGAAFNTWEWKITGVPKTLRHSRSHKGYHTVRLKSGQACVHVLILQSFVGPRPGPNHDACHIDDDKDRNILENLKWATKAENSLDRLINHGGSKLKRDDIPNIKAALSSGFRQSDVARLFGVTQSHVSRIVSGNRWHFV